MRATFVICAAFAAALLAGCGGSGDDDAAATTARTPLPCASADGVTFTTDMDSCEEAFDRGGGFAAELGLATGADTPAAEQAVATTCHQIQGTESVTYDNAAIVTLADKLNSSGVCPGVLQMLVPPTTAPASLLISSAGWTLVDVIDGDTLDIASAVEGQRRVQLIGINAPEPGECMGDEATNALRLVATGKELKIVPDVSDADAEGNNLRYLEQLDGVDLGGTMIDLGLATAVPVEPDIARGGDYAQRMVDAQTAAVGLWAPGACPPPASVAPTLPPTSTPPPTT